MNISFEYYRAFCFVAESKSITEAAKRMNISQPAITKTIKILESEIDSTLFYRNHNGMSLTPEGEKLYTYIKPISASEAKRKYGININTKEGIEIIKKDGTSRLAGEDIFRQDVQEGNNSFDRDLNLEVDGKLEYKSNTTSLELVNMPNHYISMGYDELSTKKEIKFSKRSGRDGHREPEKELLKEGASEYQDPDQRNMLRRNEEGIGEGDEIRKRQQALEEAGDNNDRVENIDNYKENDIYFIDPDEKIEDTDVTWRDLANKLRIQRRRWHSKSI